LIGGEEENEWVGRKRGAKRTDGGVLNAKAGNKSAEEVNW
jgi:hypothetical protein